MAVLSGNAGLASFAGANFPITGWSITKTNSTANVTDSSSVTWEDHIAAGFRKWSGSFEGWFKNSQVKPTMNAIVAAVFTVASGVTYSGNIIITSEATALTVDGTTAVKLTYNFQGTGALTEANP